MMKRLSASVILLVLVLTCTWPARTQTQTAGRSLLEAYVSAWNRRDFTALDKLLAPDAVHEDMARPSREEGLAQIKQSIRATIEEHPDIRWHLISIVDGGSTVAAEWVWTGNLKGDDRVAPRRISGRGASVVVIDKGQIKRVSDYYDFDSVFH